MVPQDNRDRNPTEQILRAIQTLLININGLVHHFLKEKKQACPQGEYKLTYIYKVDGHIGADKVSGSVWRGQNKIRILKEMNEDHILQVFNLETNKNDYS